MKSYTNFAQSKKLAGILPIESADMKIFSFGIVPQRRVVPIDDIAALYGENEIPCWSLAALLNILSNKVYSIDEDANVILSSYKNVEWNLSICNSDIDSVTDSDPIDACVEMIFKLNEQNFLQL